MSARLREILVVDDNVADTFLHRETLQAMCVAERIVEAPHGQAALELLAERRANAAALPELILLDVNRPVMGGWEFLNNEIDDDDEIEGDGADSESDFEPSGSEEESDFDESGSESLVESDDDDNHDDSSDDEGMDWDELEEEALAADEVVSDSDDRKRKRGRSMKKHT